jgi:hypothetical protein
MKMNAYLELSFYAAPLRAAASMSSPGLGGDMENLRLPNLILFTLIPDAFRDVYP